MHRRSRFPVDPNLAGLFASRGKIYAHRYLQTNNPFDLDDATTAMREAFALARETRPVLLGPALGNLAALLLEQFKSTGKDAMLNEALQFARWALDCFSHRGPDRALAFVTLGTILANRYDCSKKSQDLEEAIASLQAAAQLRGPSGDAALSAVISNNLVCFMERRYNFTGRREHLHDAIDSALQATKIELPNDPSLEAGMYLNLASLLTRRFEATGRLDSLTDALFELRIATKVSPESRDLDAILGHLSGLAEEQHTLRAQPMDEKIEVSHSSLRHARPLTLLFILFMLLSHSVAHLLAFCLLIVFLGGIILDWGVQAYNGTTSNDWPRNLLQSTPNWIQEILSSYDHPTFALRLCSTPWIDSRSEEEPHRSEKWRMPMPTLTTSFEPNRDEERKTKAMLQSLACSRDRVEANLDSIYPGFNKVSHTRPFRSSPPLQALSRAAGYYEDRLDIQKQISCDEFPDSGFWSDDFCDSPSGSERSGISLDTPEERKDSPCANDPNECVPNLVTETRETEQTIPDTIKVSRSCSSRQSATEVAILEFLENDDAIPTSPKNFPRDNTSEPHDKPSSTALPPLIATKETPTSSNETHSDHGSQIFNDKNNALGQKFVDRKVHSRRPPMKIEKDSSAFDSVAQGNTSNDMNKNEGNAMGNIYSEEANVVGHLSRHYGDIFETKNISAVLRGSQTPGLDVRVSQNFQEATLDKPHTEHLPQEVLDEYIHDIGNLPEERQPSGYQKAPRNRKSKHGRGSISGVDSENGSQFSTVEDPDRDKNGGPVAEQSDGSFSELEGDMSIRRSNGAYVGEKSSHTPKKRATETRQSESSARGTGDTYIQRSPPAEGVSNDDQYDELEAGRRTRPSKPDRNHSSRPLAESRIYRSATTGARKNRQRGNDIPPQTLKIEIAPKIEDFDTAHDQVQALWSYFKESLKPRCDNFNARFAMPEDPKKREFEYNILTETLVTQVLLQADSIEPGDDETTRIRRRRLIKEVQVGLSVLDASMQFQRP